MTQPERNVSGSIGVFGALDTDDGLPGGHAPDGAHGAELADGEADPALTWAPRSIQPRAGNRRATRSAPQKPSSTSAVSCSSGCWTVTGMPGATARTRCSGPARRRAPSPARRRADRGCGRGRVRRRPGGCGPSGRRTRGCRPAGRAGPRWQSGWGSCLTGRTEAARRAAAEPRCHREPTRFSCRSRHLPVASWDYVSLAVTPWDPQCSSRAHIGPSTSR